MKDLLEKISGNRKFAYPFIGAVLGVVVLALVTVLGAPAVYVLLALAGGGLAGHLYRKFSDDEF